MNVSIITSKNENWIFDTETERIFKDGVLVPNSVAEPVYSGGGENIPPNFAGILLKETGEIISINGKTNKLIGDSENII